MEKLIAVFLKGRRFRKFADYKLLEFRKSYDLKEIEVEIINILFETPECDTVASIHKYLDLNKGHISQSMFSLLNKDYVIAEQDKNDRRYIHYKLTEKGKEVGEKLSMEWKRIYKELFLGISTEQMNTFKEVFNKIENNIINMK